MTSSAQLKYLDAIGIPVWVSRDRVSQLTALQSHNAEQTSATGSDCIGSADDILHSLDNSNREKLAADKTSPETNTATTTTNLKPPTTQINEIKLIKQLRSDRQIADVIDVTSVPPFNFDRDALARVNSPLR